MPTNSRIFFLICFIFCFSYLPISLRALVGPASSWIPVDENRYSIAPAFDQLPMTYAPTAAGNMRRQAVEPVRPRADLLEVWQAAADLARTFWQRAAEAELEEDMHGIAEVHLHRP